MPDLTILGILAVVIATFHVSYSAIVVANKRGDEALMGLVRGVPISAATRRMILLTHYMPLASFLAGFLIIVCVGLVSFAQSVTDERASALGYTGGILCGMGAVTWIMLGGAWVFHSLAALKIEPD